jgi:hypothetical protein
MNLTLWTLLATLVVLPNFARELDLDRYAWEFPVATAIPQDQVADLKSQLTEQIENILAAGSLTPCRVNHADESTDAYFVYLEPGRIITTLAWAYPHLTAVRQVAVKSYVHQQFESETFAPWNLGRLSAEVAGTRREFHPINRIGNWTPNWQSTRPTIQSLYGAWLWAYRADDFKSVKPHWNSIKSCYQAKLSQGDIYSTMSAHLAMLRLAEAFGDAAMKAASWLNLSNNLQMGLNFNGDPAINTDQARMSQVEKNTLRMYLANNNGGLYWPKQNGSIYRGMMFFSISPEIGRYLAENVKEQTLLRHNYGKSRFPLWWMVDAPYFQRDYTGDEGVGLVQPEMMGTLFPIEKWVMGTDATILAGYMASAPSCRGDCVWIESLAQTIESFGGTRWIDVRSRTTD